MSLKLIQPLSNRWRIEISEGANAPGEMNGDGTFQVPMNVATGSGTYDAAVADFDADGTMNYVSSLSTGTLVMMKGACK